MGSVYDMFYSWYVLFKWCYKVIILVRFYVLSILLFHPPISSISGGNVHRKDVLGCFRGLVCQPRGKTQCTPLSGFTVYLCHNVGTPGTPSSPSGDNADWMLSTPAILISKLDSWTFSIILAARCHRIVASLDSKTLDPRHRGRLLWRSVGRNLAATATTPGMLWL